MGHRPGEFTFPRPRVKESLREQKYSFGTSLGHVHVLFDKKKVGELENALQKILVSHIQNADKMQRWVGIVSNGVMLDSKKRSYCDSSNPV